MEFLNTHQWVVTAVIVPILGALIGVLSAWITSRRLKKNEDKRRPFEGMLKIAEFRQQWINKLRSSMSEFQSYGILPNLDPTKEREFYKLGTEIELLMNPNDEDYRALQDSLYSFLSSAKASAIEKYKNNPGYIEICQKILKREWERLKTDLEHVQ